MNYQKLQKVRDVMAAHMGQIHMDLTLVTAGHEAGNLLTTGGVACIAGFTVAVFKPGMASLDGSRIMSTAREILELQPKEAEHLFCGLWSERRSTAKACP